MRTIRGAAAGLGVLACTALSACGGGAKAPAAPPASPEQAAAIASVRRLAKAVGAGDSRQGCRALTLATRRVVGLTGGSGESCSAALRNFLVVHRLRRTLPGASGLHAVVRGERAEVRGSGLPGPLTTAHNAGGWRVSLVGLPGVRADVRAARACGRYLDTADAIALPSFAPAALAAQLRSQARLIDGLRRRLVALPSTGPARLGLPDVLAALITVRDGLRAQARRVAAGGSVERAAQAGARADLVVRALLGTEGRQARIACPLDATKGPELAARRTQLDAACRDFGDTIDQIDSNPATPEEARALLRRVDGALATFDRRLRRAPVAPRLRRLRGRARGAVASLRAEVARLATGPDDATLAVLGRRIDGYGAQIDAALIRLGATCLDSFGAAPPPSRASPAPRGAPAPSPSSPKQPPGTVLS